MNPEFVRTICPYCGTGCGLVLKVENGRAAASYPDRENPVSKGSLCVKGWVAHEFVHHPERLTAPQRDLKAPLNCGAFSFALPQVI